MLTWQPWHRHRIDLFPKVFADLCVPSDPTTMAQRFCFWDFQSFSRRRRQPQRKTENENKKKTKDGARRKRNWLFFPIRTQQRTRRPSSASSSFRGTAPIGRLTWLGNAAVIAASGAVVSEILGTFIVVTAWPYHLTTTTTTTCHDTGLWELHCAGYLGKDVAGVVGRAWFWKERRKQRAILERSEEEILGRSNKNATDLNSWKERGWAHECHALLRALVNTEDASLLSWSSDANSSSSSSSFEIKFQTACNKAKEAATSLLSDCS